MIVYIPTPITSAEQAESLPEGTVTIGTRCGVIEKGSRGRWWAGFAELPDRIAVGGTALVPIEAEEEWGVEMSEGGAVTHVVRAVTREHAERTLPHQEPGAARIVHRIRATPWKWVDGPSPDHRGDCA